MATQKAIVTQLTRFSTALRHKLSPEELAALTLTWGELFQRTGDDELAGACALVMRRCRFFPAPAEVAAALDQLRAAPRHCLATLPAGSPDLFALWVAEISRRVCRKSHKFPRPHPQAFAYFDLRPGMSRERERLAREFLGEEFVAFEDWQAERNAQNKEQAA